MTVYHQPAWGQRAQWTSCLQWKPEKRSPGRSAGPRRPTGWSETRLDPELWFGQSATTGRSTFGLNESRKSAGSRHGGSRHVYLRSKLRQSEVARQAEGHQDQEQRGWEAEPECLVGAVRQRGGHWTPILIRYTKHSLMFWQNIFIFNPQSCSIKVRLAFKGPILNYNTYKLTL